jgi:hypothetical protein
VFFYINSLICIMYYCYRNIIKFKNLKLKGSLVCDVKIAAERRLINNATYLLTSYLRSSFWIRNSDLYINLRLICNYNTFANEKPPSPNLFILWEDGGGGGWSGCRFFIIRSFHSKLSLCFDRMLPLHTAIILRGISFSAVVFHNFDSQNIHFGL